MWITCLIIAAVIVVAINNWVTINIIIYRYRFPDLGPAALIDKLLEELDAVLDLDDRVLHERTHEELTGLKVKMIKAIIEAEGIGQ